MSPLRLTAEQVRWFRLQRSGLGPTPFDSPEAAAAGLAGVQAQILPAAALALWNRSAEGAATYAQFAARLHEQRTLVKLWGQRHTLHVYATNDWPLIHAAFSEKSTWWERQIKRAGRPEELEVYRAAIARVLEMLRERGSMGRRELRAIEHELPAALLSPWGGVFAELVRAGYACHARWEGGEAKYAARDHWLPSLAWAPPSVHDANVDLARRYLRCYGPARLPDLAYWHGVSGAIAHKWLAGLGDEVTQVLDPAGKPALALAADLPDLTAEPPPRARWPVRLLGRFDPMLLGHKGKGWVVPRDYYSRVWRPAGHIEAVILEHGQAAGTWRYDRASGGVDITVRPFRRLSARVQSAIRQRARGVAKFFALALGELRFADAAA